MSKIIWKKATDKQEKPLFIGCFNRSVILTYIGVGFAITGCTFISKGDLRYCILCLILSGICDMFDGYIARMCDRNLVQKQFGAQIDSLADMISFGAFPAMIYLVLCGTGLAQILVSCFYVLCGLNRLAWFNIHKKYKNFKGVPITSIVLVMSTFYIIELLSGAKVLETTLGMLLILMGIAFSLNIDIPKPNKKTYTIMSVIAIVYIILIVYWR